MPYNSLKHGWADYNSFMQTPDDFVVNEGSDQSSLTAEHYAHLVYQVNAIPISLSGVTLEAAVGIDGSGDVHVVANQLMVHDASADAGATELVVSNTYSRIIISNATYTYSMWAPAGSLSANNVWRVSRTDNGGSRMWADGNTNFDNIASNYSILTYTF